MSPPPGSTRPSKRATSKSSMLRMYSILQAGFDSSIASRWCTRNSGSATGTAMCTVYHTTVIVIEAESSPSEAVTVAFPRLFPVITPFSSTDRMSGSLLSQTISLSPATGPPTRRFSGAPSSEPSSGSLPSSDFSTSCFVCPL